MDGSTREEGIVFAISSSVIIGIISYFVFTNPIPVPADLPINEDCYELKSKHLVKVVGYDCDDEMIKMYNYGYTEITSTETNGWPPTFWMFKETK